MDIMSFIPETLFILVVATNILGVFLKQAGFVKDNIIPVILLMFTVTFSVAMQGITPDCILQGIIVWGVAIGIHQTVHQLTVKK